MENKDRAERGRKALSQYMRDNPETGAYSAGTAMRDLFADLFHAYGADEVSRAVAMGQRHHEAETEGAV